MQQRAHHVADGVVEKEVVAGRDTVVVVGIESEIKGAGGVAQRGGDVLCVHLHESVSKLVVFFEQQLLARLPEVVVAGDRKLQRLFRALREHGVQESGF